MKTFSILSHKNNHYYLKHRIPITHHHFFRKLSQDPEYIQTHCDDRRNLLQFACLQLFLYNNPQR